MTELWFAHCTPLLPTPLGEASTNYLIIVFLDMLQTQQINKRANIPLYCSPEQHMENVASKMFTSFLIFM